MTSLQDLPGHAVTLIIQKLPSADRRRLPVCCQRLRRLCAELVDCVAVTQQDLEEWADGALCAFPNAAQLQLADVVCESSDFAHELCGAAPELLQRLKSLQVVDPASLDAQALLLLASYCTQLTQLRVRGTWSSRSNSSILPQDAAKPQRLHSLALQCNTGLSPTQLTGLLSDPDRAQRNSRFNSNSSVAADLEHAYTASGTGQPHQPQWCQQLQECCWRHVDSESAHGHDTHIVQMPSWPNLTQLDLSGCTRIGQSMGFLALCPSLRSLSLHSCSHVTDNTLQELSEALHGSSAQAAAADSGRVAISGAEECSDAAAAAGDRTADTPLQQLDLSYTRVKDPGMPHLVSAMPNLCCLGLKGCNVGDDGLQHLLRLQHLTGLHIKHCHRVTEEGIAALRGLTQLRSLSYGYTSMPEADDVVADIARHFMALEALDLLASELTDTGLTALGELQQLQRLKLYQAGITAEGLVCLASQHRGACLQELVLYGTGALRELVCLGAFPMLQQLQLGRLCDLSAPMADAICDLTAAQRLTSLTLERMDDITPGSLQHILQGCRELQVLRVRGCDGVCEEDMEELALDAAAACGSSASVWWAAAASVDTDDEEDGWQMLPPV